MGSGNANEEMIFFSCWESSSTEPLAELTLKMGKYERNYFEANGELVKILKNGSKKGKTSTSQKYIFSSIIIFDQKFASLKEKNPLGEMDAEALDANCVPRRMFGASNYGEFRGDKGANTSCRALNRDVLCPDCGGKHGERPFGVEIRRIGGKLNCDLRR